MSNITTNLSKMATKLENEIQYFLAVDNEWLPMNELIGKPIILEFEGQINCIICGKKTKKSFGNGACYSCFMSAPESSPCIINPELCEAHLGKGRDIEWEQKHHNQPHVVYLAKSSAIKVGVTRATQVPTRWIDQGASEAIILAEVPYRRLAGEIEVQLKNHFTDKTNWQQMLKNIVATDDLLQVKEEVLNYYLDAAYHEFISDNDTIISLNYPVENYPAKIKSVRLDTVPIIESTLRGIKGQYLYFGSGQVFNVRNHSGYLVSLRW
ncbi:MAG: DUF2797 domain-containing protein [Bacteroidetes bacterium]|nr:DUF2797 domain-containing protein [Bacteroidota bacterium]MCB9226532.1 DUF2797 domain-containing protein [Chitinophagales bacterium]